MTDPHTGLADLIDLVRAEALKLGRDDLAAFLPAPPGAREAPRRPRIVVAGGPGRGKSRLINSLIGRPGLSPVGSRPTTGGWVEFRYGPDDSAVALIADPRDPGTPRRMPIPLTALHAYAKLDEVEAPVLGVEVRLDAPILRDLILVDTPGVGGPNAALRHTDGLLFVSDASEPVTEREMAFLAVAAQRLDTIVVAVNKSDAVGHERALAETRRRLAGHPDLARLPVVGISARLAEQAGRPDTPHPVAIRLTELAGTRQLIDLITYEATAGVRRRRATNQAHATAAVARELLAHLDRLTGPADRLDADIATVTTLLDGGGLLGARFEEARQTATQRFTARADELGERHREAAESGPGVDLDALPPRLVIGLAAAGVAALDETEVRILEALRDSLRDDVLLPPAAELELRLRAGDAAAPRRTAEESETVARGRDLLPTLTGLLTGSAMVLTLITGSAVVGADLALAACAGWWRLRGDAGPQRRIRLATWAEAAVAEAKRAFEGELRERAGLARQYVAEALPRILEARLERLRGMRAARAPADAEVSRETLARVLDELSRRSVA
ncbi:dynamin family protein [Actinoplanes sp. NPDC051513]|uniref:dynamin family protein n=1 Tax=Actinoplanes sp. NPDC051513 TaxID=3363908 RepID=UPI0037A456F6